ncbi:DUF2304 domain-containing protein [Candidatus Uhrbacteria bacterium]|nr:DUF2304 domain-containing protein [Candidatus Uhrbacteria bacterium]
MLVIQILILIFILFALSRTVLQFRERKLRVHWFVVWLLLWAGVGFVVLRPEVTSRLARFVGITRGADLVVYTAIIVLSYLVFRVLVKIESLEGQITKLVRHLALDDKKKGE